MRSLGAITDDVDAATPAERERVRVYLLTVFTRALDAILAKPAIPVSA